MYKNTDLADLRRKNLSGRARFIGIVLAALMIVLLVVAQVSAAVNGNPPTPRFVSPLDGWNVEGTAPVKVYAPALPLFRAELGVDGGSWQPMYHKGDGVFFANWNSAYVENGKHTLTARFALELGGPPEVAVSIHVMVDNEMPDANADRAGPRLADGCIDVYRPLSLLYPEICVPTGGGTWPGGGGAVASRPCIHKCAPPATS